MYIKRALLSKLSTIRVAYIKHCPGHKGFDGKLREWCIVSHDTGKILQSYSSKSEAEKALKRMRYFKHKG